MGNKDSGLYSCGVPQLICLYPTDRLRGRVIPYASAISIRVIRGALLLVILFADPEQRHRLKKELLPQAMWPPHAEAQGTRVKTPGCSLGRNLGTIWYWSRGSYRRRRDTRSLPTSRESTYLPQGMLR